VIQKSLMRSARNVGVVVAVLAVMVGIVRLNWMPFVTSKQPSCSESQLYWLNTDRDKDRT
jgi:hypothetical protein